MSEQALSAVQTLDYVKGLTDNIASLLVVLEYNQNCFIRFKPATVDLFDEIFKTHDADRLITSIMDNILKNTTLNEMEQFYRRKKQIRDCLFDVAVGIAVISILALMLVIPVLQLSLIPIILSVKIGFLYSLLSAGMTAFLLPIITKGQPDIEKLFNTSRNALQIDDETKFEITFENGKGEEETIERSAKSRDLFQRFFHPVNADDKLAQEVSAHLVASF